MMSRNPIFFSSLILFMFFVFLPQWLMGQENTASIDRGKIKNLYFEGEFDQVKTILERESNVNELNSEDQIFAYRLLGVVYSADNSTYHKAESYFYQLLRLSPRIELVDLYVSNSVQNLFLRVKRQYHKEVSIGTRYDDLGRPLNSNSSANLPTSTNSQAQASGKNKSWIKWTLGGSAVVVTGLTAFFLLSGNSGDEQQSGNININ